MVIFDFSFLKEIIIDLLKILSEKNLNYFNSFDEVFNHLNEKDIKYQCLYNVLESAEKENMLKEICKISINNNLEKEIVLDIDKIKLFLAKYIISNEENNYMELEKFVEYFNKYFYLYIPLCISKEE